MLFGVVGLGTIVGALGAATASSAGREGRLLTIGLVIAIVVMVAVAAVEAVYVWVPGEPVPSSARPVNADSLTVASTVDIAAKATQKIVASSYKTYDQQVDAAARTMTPTFAAKYRSTKAQIKDRFVAEKTVVDVEITGQSVMSASDEQVLHTVGDQRFHRLAFERGIPQRAHYQGIPAARPGQALKHLR